MSPQALRPIGLDLPDPVDRMLRLLAAGDGRALARAVSLVEDGGAGAGELLAGCTGLSLGRGTGGRRVGITGPPGAGKSTLVDRMIRALRARGHTVGVVAVDPSSPYTGGALLGDRIRMQGFAGDDGVFIRSMASRGAVGGLTRGVEAACSVMEAAGRHTLLIETVGVGQDEVAIAALADVTVLVLTPGMGDDVQSLKAGVMEIADIFAVNKSDQPGAERVECEIVAMQELAADPGGFRPRVIRTVAITGGGVERLLEEVERLLAEPHRARPRSRTAQSADPLPARARVDHLGIAVRSIEAARGFYELLGLHVGEVETVEHEEVRTAMLALGETRLELLEPLAEDSTIGRFLARRGEGLHHVALGVDGLQGYFTRLGEAGVRLASDRIRVGAGGHRYFFVHPASTGGVLVELVEA